MVTENSIRLTPQASSKIGWLWNQQANYFTAWEVVMTFQVSGARLGADGFAFWAVEEPKKEGSAYGYANQWKGLGVIFDTYDNDGGRNNPYIAVIFNDGSKVYDTGIDGGDMSKEGCVSHFRNTRTKIKVRYESGFVDVRTSFLFPPDLHLLISHIHLSSLSKVSVDVGERGNYQACARVRAEISTGNYFGLTAATGAVSGK
jgi:hypothetical protein